MIIRIKKGYTLTVKSWENDGDNSNELSKTVETLDEAKVWYYMMQLCKSKNRSQNTITLGNSYDGFNSQQKEVAANYLKENFKILLLQDDFTEDEDTLVDWFCDLAGELLGYGENYACRVMESCVVTYSDKDISVEEINF